MNRTLFRRRERHGLHVADALAADPGHDDGRWTGPGEAPLPQLQISEEVQAELGRLTEQAKAEQRTATLLLPETEPWTRPDDLRLSPEDMRADPRPYVPRPAVPVWTPVPAAESADRMARLTYPQPGDTRERYAAVMRQVSAYTGTRSSFDLPAAWTSARPGPAEAPVTCWTPQHAPRLAIEAGTGVAA